jgi:CBS domain-containing protein
MWNHDIGCLPIVDHEGRIIGMLTDRDVCMAAYLQGGPLTSASVTSAMSKEVYTCSEGDDTSTVETLMREKQVHRLPVVDAERRPIGIISINDLAREASREVEFGRARQITDSEVACTVASLSTPRNRIVEAHA